MSIHQGFFRFRDAVERHRLPRRLAGYGRRAFDQGLGRCLWFGEVADPERIARRIASFPAHRRSDLWSGVGLAATYADGAGEGALARLVELAGAGGHRAELAQGAAFAAKARRLDGTIRPENDLACRLLAGRSAAEAAALADRTFDALPAAAGAGEPRFELWRRRLREELAPACVSFRVAERPEKESTTRWPV